jgi:hypothetical protein
MHGSVFDGKSSARLVKEEEQQQIASLSRLVGS